MKNNSFNIQIPENFILDIDQFSSIRATNASEKFDHQIPLLSLTIQKVAAIKTQKGSTFLDQYTAWSAGFKSEVVSTEERQLNSYKTIIIYAKTDAEFQGDIYKVNYLNACILIDEEWCLDYQFIYETKDANFYENLAETTLQSIEVKGTNSDWQEAHLQDIQVTETHQEGIIEKTQEDVNQITSFEIPKDGKENIQIDNFSFEFIQDKSYWRTVEVSKRLYVQVQIKTSQIALAKEKELIEYHHQLEDGEIQLSFDCFDIFNKSIPTGKFNFEEGKTGAPQHLHFRSRGINSRLNLYGEVIMKDGWLGINGDLKCSYQDKPQFNILIYKKLPTEQIDWSMYQFSREEAQQTNAETVQYLNLKNYIEKDFPEEALAYINLKELAIYGSPKMWETEKSPFRNLPESIGNFKGLEQLSLFNTSVTQLPTSLGTLKKLTRLHLNNNLLTSLPDGIFQLPNIRYLWLKNNLLEEIPNSINLPELIQADFNRNQLKTLPEDLAHQPKLEKLDLNSNPWQSLPDAFNHVSDIELNIDDKRRLLNFEYQGADGKGVTSWKESNFLAKHDANLHSVFLTAIKNTVLEKHQTSLEKLALKSINLNSSEEDDYSTPGNTRFGGLPDLPQGSTYPTWHCNYYDEQEDCHYIFIAQLNCAELANYQDYLPREGMLYFYIEEEEDFTPKVVYHPTDRDLQSAQQINAETLNIFDSGEPYHPFKVAISNFVGIPSSFYSNDYWVKYADSESLKTLEDGDDDLFMKQNDDIRKSLGKKGRYQEWNNCYYPDSQHSINDYVFTQHESPQEQAALKYKGNPEDWMVLLKVSSDNNSGFCFWDAGELFFVIHKSDLAKGDFSKIFASIETS